MPRSARQKSKTGIYHVVLRGINRQIIFVEDEDATKFLQTLARYKEESGYEIYAYCLMSNHIHILLKEGTEDFALTMKRIGAGYVYWYNYKYERCGHLFQDRYKSEAVEDDRYLLAVLRYIHQNPVKANIAKDIGDYKWSSYREYLGRPGITDCSFLLNTFSKDKQKAIYEFKVFHKKEEETECLDLKEKILIKDEDAIEIIKGVTRLSNLKEMQSMSPANRDYFLSLLKKEGLSTRQITRLTGILRHIVLKA